MAGTAVALRSAALPERPAAATLATPQTGGLAPARIPRWTRRPRPQLGEDRPSSSARFWWLGVHGGAGVSTLTQLVPGGADAFRRWPAPAVHGGPPGVVLVCRTHARGLLAARGALLQWRQRQVPEGLDLLGVVAIADAAGRLPSTQSQTLRLIYGAVDRMWVLPFVEDFRQVPDVRGLPLPPSMVAVVSALDALCPEPVTLR